MTDPITPPPELVVEWADTIYQQTECDDQRDLYVATQAAQWAADQELEACLANIHTMYGKDKADWLRAMRRPKPPSLKEQAMQLLETYNTLGVRLTADQATTIRRALEALPE